VLGIFVALAGCTIIQAFNLMFLNKLQERKRVRNGKSAKIKDHSMEDKYHDADEQVDVLTGAAEGDMEAAEEHHHRVGEQAFLDLTVSANSLGFPGLTDHSRCYRTGKMTNLSIYIEQASQYLVYGIFSYDAGVFSRPSYLV